MQVTALFSEGLRINLLEPYGAVGGESTTVCQDSSQPLNECRPRLEILLKSSLGCPVKKPLSSVRASSDEVARVQPRRFCVRPHIRRNAFGIRSRPFNILEALPPCRMAQLLATILCGRAAVTKKRSEDVPTGPGIPESQFPVDDELVDVSAIEKRGRMLRAGSSSRSLLSPACSPVCSLKFGDLEMEGARNRGHTPSPCPSEDFMIFHTVFHKKQGVERAERTVQHSAPRADLPETAAPSVLRL